MISIIQKQKATITLVALCAEIALPFALYAALQGDSNFATIMLFTIAVGLKLALIFVG